MKILSGFLSGFLSDKTRGFTFIHPKNMGGGDTPETEKIVKPQFLF